MSYDPSHPVSSVTGKPEPSHTNWWTVIAPLNVMLVEAGSREQAIAKALHKAKLDHKPYLARDWDAHPTTAEERVKYASQLVAIRRSEPTARTAKRKSKNARDRLL
jgi:hypothetical protein